jgi:hypothetical protein
MPSSIVNKICGLLENEGIEYMVTGGYACRIYTAGGPESDVDIVLNLTQNNTQKFGSVVYSIFGFNPLYAIEEFEAKGRCDTPDKDSGTIIHFINRKDSEYRITEFNRRRKIESRDLKVWLVSIEDLIISKFIKIQEDRIDEQIEDIQNLLDNPQADYYYIQHWCSKLNLNTFGLLDYE